MNIKKLVDSLHPLEREILPILDKHNDIEEIARITNIKEVAVNRALKWLENKELAKVEEFSLELVRLDTNGKKYLEEGLPEKNLLLALRNKELTVNQAKKETNLTNDEINAAIGTLRKRNLIFITKDKKLKIIESGKKILEKGLPEEQFLKKEFPLKYSDIKDKKIIESLRARKNILKIETTKSISANLTETGQKILESGTKLTDTIDSLTSFMIKYRSWKGKKFRRFDIKSHVPRTFAGKKQQYRSFLDSVRQKFQSLGFEEMTGPLVETDFWNMDALFMPQFHSARDIHEAYYVKEPKYGKLDAKLVEQVKQAHENGFGTGSKGWQYKFDTKRTHRHILRTQGTACSARKLTSPDLKIPGKYFGMTRCFRYDVVDATHLADFNQTEGIVVEEGLNLKHLFGLLKLFAEEFAETDQIKITPGYFPFTEPSAELHAKHPQLGWIELGGSGIFRPEMCKSLGTDVPVIAWGLGIDRIAMFKLGIKDIRDLFTHDLDFLRKAKVI